MKVERLNINNWRATTWTCLADIAVSSITIKPRFFTTDGYYYLACIHYEEPEIYRMKKEE